MQKKNILITGGSGLLAINWANLIKKKHCVILTLHQKNITLSGVQTIKLSLHSKIEITRTLAENNIDYVVHTAGMTNIETCAKNPKLAKEVNVGLTKNVTRACKDYGAKLIHISTDHLFAGNASFASEEKSCMPINVYGKTKYMSEKFILRNNPEALIIRSNFFGWGTSYRKSFSDFIINNLRNDHGVELFDDIFYTPILIAELVRSVHQLIDLDAKGIFNVTSGERLSKYEFGIKVANAFKLNTHLITRSQIEKKINLVKRPKDMSLSNAKLRQTIKKLPISLEEQIVKLKQEEINKKTEDQAIVNIIPYGQHYIDKDDIKAVTQTLSSGVLTQGNKVFEFERKIAKYVGAKYAIAVSSGTAALHLTSLALGLTKGDGVITTPNTFVATSNAALYTGAMPIFVDIDKQTLNINPKLLEQAITNNINSKAIFPVHFAGLACDMKHIKTLGRKYHLSIIEDAVHALGATYEDGSRVGNCRYSDMCVFSFHPVKGITAGEGGMITTNNEQIYRKLFMLRSHGITKGNFDFPGISVADNTLINREEALENNKLKRWYYEMQYLGYNYRITDIQSALASSQMNKIDKFLKRRYELVKQYDLAFMQNKIITPLQRNFRKHSSHHIYVIHIDFEKLNITRNHLMNKLAEQGIGSQVHYIPIPMQPYYKKLGYQISDYPVTFNYYQNALSIPLYYGLSDNEQDYIVKNIINTISANKR